MLQSRARFEQKRGLSLEHLGLWMCKRLLLSPLSLSQLSPSIISITPKESMTMVAIRFQTNEAYRFPTKYLSPEKQSHHLFGLVKSKGLWKNHKSCHVVDVDKSKGFVLQTGIKRWESV
ncbi:hypothetical protein LXL04_039383 [Taraxacum kok-saghyz]